ncbi:hypothetical protein, partial [Burkholderia pseudomallei]|uniref:hypothetical protein n=1 Tax=Burkholderia pseudomallei TaxID=28450 RepID=UPI001C9B12A8
RLTDRHKTIPYFKSVLVSSDTWGRSKVARALYFHHHQGGRKLLGDLQVWPLFIPVDPDVAPELASAVCKVRASTGFDFEKLPKHGAHQEIFAYQINEVQEVVVVNMEFYGAHRVSVMRG